MVVCSGDLTQGRESRVVGDHQRYPYKGQNYPDTSVVIL